MVNVRAFVHYIEETIGEDAKDGKGEIKGVYEELI